MASNSVSKDPPPEVKVGKSLDEQLNVSGDNGNDKAIGGPSPNNPSNKRKHHRRARKNQKRLLADNEVDRSLFPKPPAHLYIPAQKSRRPNHQQQKQVYLRPTNGPLLNAPRNSTQFIIDDHEDSDQFVNFEVGGAANLASPDDDLHNQLEEEDAWAEYSERDFQSVYETAHQEEISAWDRKKLCDEMARLERRQKDLVCVLARLDPEIYLQKLQSDLLRLQEDNNRIKDEKRELNPELPDSSTNEAATPPPQQPGQDADENSGYSSSSSSSSSSSCSSSSSSSSSSSPAATPPQPT